MSTAYPHSMSHATAMEPLLFDGRPNSRPALEAPTRRTLHSPSTIAVSMIGAFAACVVLLLQVRNLHLPSTVYWPRPQAHDPHSTWARTHCNGWCAQCEGHSLHLIQGERGARRGGGARGVTLAHHRQHPLHFHRHTQQLRRPAFLQCPRSIPPALLRPLRLSGAIQSKQCILRVCSET